MIIESFVEFFLLFPNGRTMQFHLLVLPSYLIFLTSSGARWEAFAPFGK
jgi:hypothetical protein